MRKANRSTPIQPAENKNQELCSVSDVTLSTSYLLIDSISTYYPHLLALETEAQRDEVFCPRSLKQQQAELGSNTAIPAFLLPRSPTCWPPAAQLFLLPHTHASRLVSAAACSWGAVEIFVKDTASEMQGQLRLVIASQCHEHKLFGFHSKLGP